MNTSYRVRIFAILALLVLTGCPDDNRTPEQRQADKKAELAARSDSAELVVEVGDVRLWRIYDAGYPVWFTTPRGDVIQIRSSGKTSTPAVVNGIGCAK